MEGQEREGRRTDGWMRSWHSVSEGVSRIVVHWLLLESKKMGSMSRSRSERNPHIGGIHRQTSPLPISSLVAMGVVELKVKRASLLHEIRHEIRHKGAV